MESNVRVKSKSKKEDPPAEEVKQEMEQPGQDVMEMEPEPEQPKPKKEYKPRKAAKEVKKEEYEVEQQPDVVIHKRHKGAKPRKVIVITGDSSADESDEDLPYRAKPKVQIKPRPAPAPAPKPNVRTKQQVGLIAEKPKPVDTGKGISQRYATPEAPKKNYVVDAYIDELLGLT